MEEKILNLFYQKVVPEASTGEIHIEDWVFHIGFSVLGEGRFLTEKRNEQDIVLVISCFSTFHSALVEYVEKMLAWLLQYPAFRKTDSLFFDGNWDAIATNCLASLWVNATSQDFLHPENYLRRRIDFLEQETKEEISFPVVGGAVPSLGDSHVSYCVAPQNPCTHETPYVFQTKISSQEGEYLLPAISFGISDAICYVYSIQAKKKQELTPYQKKMNRLFYKANQGVEDSSEESIRDISASQIIALTCFLDFLKKRDIQKMEAISYLPIRYQAKSRVIEKRLKKVVDQEEVRKQLEEERDFLQTNISNKFLRIFRRLCYHFPEVQIQSFPYEEGEGMRFSITESLEQEKDHFLHQIYQSLQDVEKRKEDYL